MDRHIKFMSVDGSIWIKSHKISQFMEAYGQKHIKFLSAH